jgi:hypothetical protein
MVITIRWRDHNPPHFHVRYAEDEACYEIRGIARMEGGLPPRAHSMILEWAALHQQELLDNWQLAQNRQPLKMIEPLT